MKNLLVSILTASGIASASILPAMAEESMKDMAKTTALLPVKVVAVSTGMALGIPVAMVRRSVTRYKGYTDEFADHVGGKDSMPAVFLATTLSGPFSILVGASEGVYYGSKNALEHGVAKPFSKDSFSLGEME